jgi:hypothetical protein
MEVHQYGDREGSLLFDPSRAEHAKLAIQVAGVKRRRTMSDALWASLNPIFKNRLDPSLKTTSSSG